MTWTPREEAQFDRACTHCGQAIRRWGNGNWQGYSGFFTCWAGQYPTRADLDRHHIPAPDDAERPTSSRQGPL